MFRYLLLLLLLSGTLSAQIFNRAKGYGLSVTEVELEQLPNGNTVVSLFDGDELQLSLWDANGDSIKEVSLPLSFKFLMTQGLKRLGPNRLALSLTYRDGCDIISGYEQRDILLDEQLNILDSITFYDQGNGVLFAGRIQAFQDSTYMVDGLFGFKILDFQGGQLNVLYDTLNINPNFQSYVLNSDSILLIGGGSTRIFRYSDSTYLPQSFLPSYYFWDFDRKHFAQSANANSSSVDLIRKSDLSMAGSYSSPLGRPIETSLYFGDSLVLLNDSAFAVIDRSTNQLVDSGVFLTPYLAIGQISDLALRSGILVSAGSGNGVDLHLESQELNKAPSLPFQGLEYSLKANSRQNFQVTIRNTGVDTIRKVGMGIRTGNTPYFCQNIWYRRIKYGLNILPGDSLQLSFLGDPFSSDTIPGVAPHPFFIYMVNNQMVDEDDRLASSVQVITQEEFALNDLKLFPNPVKSLLKLEYHGAEGAPLHLKLFSSDGKCLLQEVWSLDHVKQYQIDLEHFVPGTYILELKSSGTVYRERIIKLR